MLSEIDLTGSHSLDPSHRFLSCFHKGFAYCFLYPVFAVKPKHEVTRVEIKCIAKIPFCSASLSIKTKKKFTFEAFNTFVPNMIKNFVSKLKTLIIQWECTEIKLEMANCETNNITCFVCWTSSRTSTLWNGFVFCFFAWQNWHCSKKNIRSRWNQAMKINQTDTHTKAASWSSFALQHKCLVSQRLP